MTVHVTRHAIERYRERVADVSDERAVEALTSRAIELADDFGAPVVRLGGGQRVVLKNHSVITVLPAERAQTIASQRRGLAPRCFSLLPPKSTNSERSDD